MKIASGTFKSELACSQRRHEYLENVSELESSNFGQYNAKKPSEISGKC
jgi:hypothetical protein